MATRQGLYKGYSSHEFVSNKRFSVYDIELVKLDLLSHIFTKRGERVMMPNFGTIIPEVVFEPLTRELVEIIREEVERVLDYDPRVEILDIKASPDYDRGIVLVAANVFYIELNLVDNFELNIEFEAQ